MQYTYGAHSFAFTNEVWKKKHSNSKPLQAIFQSGELVMQKSVARFSLCSQFVNQCGGWLPASLAIPIENVLRYCCSNWNQNGKREAETFS